MMDETFIKKTAIWINNFLSKFTARLITFMLTIAANSAYSGETGNLKPEDFVGISFWIISMTLVAATVFFFLERDRVSPKWKTSLSVSGLVTLVAAVHYFYMRDVWVHTSSTPTVFRYIDWMITVPLLMIEFFLILSAITKVPAGVFWRLMIGTLVMLVGGFMGESGNMPVMPAFIIGMVGWAFIIYEIYGGEAGKINSVSAPIEVQSAFNSMRLIVIFGWSVYPIGYFYGYLNGAGPEQSAAALNVIYNFADLLNKVAFGLIIWAVAVSQSESEKTAR